MKHYLKICIAVVSCNFIYLHAFPQSNSTHKKEVEEWYNKRIQNLKSENGWLNVAGLYWLEEGKNTFGSGSLNKIVFPKGTIADKAGYFERKGNSVKIIAASNVAINVNNKPATEALIFSTDSLRTSIVSSGDLQWTVIKRDDKLGIRLRNLKSPLLNTFPGIESFAVDSSWKITATLQTENQPKGLFITNIIGQTNEQKLAGKLVFTINGKQYALDALDEGDNLFVIFGDATSGETTYPSGRFLYAKNPDADGKTIIDFNKAYNPPCAFTEYATPPCRQSKIFYLLQ